MTRTIRTLILLVTLGFFAGVTTANACDGDKAACKHPKGTKTAMKDCKDAKCMKDGKCTMTKAEMKKSGCCSAHAKAGKAMSMKSMKDCPAGATGKHDCCKAKPSGDKS
jgi:hypothetical protein